MSLYILYEEVPYDQNIIFNYFDNYELAKRHQEAIQEYHDDPEAIRLEPIEIYHGEPEVEVEYQVSVYLTLEDLDNPIEVYHDVLYGEEVEYRHRNNISELEVHQRASGEKVAHIMVISRDKDFVEKELEKWIKLARKKLNK